MNDARLFKGRIRNSGKNSKKLSGRGQNSLMLFMCMILLSGGTLWSAEGTAPISDAALNDVLVQARRSVEMFWRQFESVSCIESVTQEKLGKGGKSEYQLKSTFDYLVLLNKPEDDISVEESRVQQGKINKPKNIPLLLTDGMPTLLLIFHPYYKEDFLYQLDGEEMADGRKLARIGFSHLPGKRSTTVLRLRDSVYPLNLQGIAWIDPQMGTIHRIAAGLTAPMKGLNIKGLQLEVSYFPQKFPFEEGEYWLPSIATVNIQSEHQQWRNIHQFSKYRKFSVKSEEFVLR